MTYYTMTSLLNGHTITVYAEQKGIDFLYTHEGKVRILTESGEEIPHHSYTRKVN
jgi:hypothetical protein